ncbi:MAG: RNA 2',3'-cyclic phosphodiesterase [Candidatus Marinimicrobia bacterium]|nr:RNA 2',3'-cyclic phosphodiesterase [Candidatus Neomarinimicrobiota bacterium]
MPERLLRTFIALSVPTQVRTVQDMLKTTIEAQRKVLKWVHPNSIHVTVKFNGPTPEDLIPRLNDRLNNLVAQFQPLTMQITGTGCFPTPSRPRVLWLGLEGDLKQLHVLVQQVHRVLEKFGFPDESERFKPHVTIARLRYPQKHTPDISSFLQTEYENIHLVTDRIHLISSELLPGGPVYSNLGTHYFSSQSHKE